MKFGDQDLVTWLEEKIREEWELVRRYEIRLAETQRGLRESKEMINHYEQWLSEELARQGVTKND